MRSIDEMDGIDMNYNALIYGLDIKVIRQDHRVPIQSQNQPRLECPGTLP